MNQPPSSRKVYDCFLYNGELAALRIRFNELAPVVHRFVVVESDVTFSGIPKASSFDSLDPRISPFASKIRYVIVKDMPHTERPPQRERWQRNAILRGIPDAAADDIILVSNVDEIPRAAIVQDMVRDGESRIFGLQLACYRFFVNYRNICSAESAAIRTVAACRAELEKVTPHDLRRDVRNGRIPARVLAEAGWHFSSLVEVAGVRRRLATFSAPQDDSERLRHAIDISRIVRDHGEPLDRCGSRWDIADPRELPSWLQANHRALSSLFYPRNSVGWLAHRFVSNFKRSLSTPSSGLTTPPVIVCPYIYTHEAPEITAKFGLDKPHGRKLKFFLWQDTDGLGPERAFQHCWEQFPDRDIIILHSDMAPMPDDRSNRWYDTLVQYRDQLPCAGILACNLFYPRATVDEPWHVQCAGGTFCKGQINHLHGVLQEGVNKTKDAVPAAMLREVRAVDWVTFGGILIRREVIQACCPLDDRYRWAYVIDVDFCFEARLRGFHLVQVPVALQHQENRTTRAFFEKDAELRERMLHNYELFYDKWRPFGAVLSTERADVPKAFELSVGEEVLFHRDARGADFLVGGWSRPEDWGVWSDGPVAKLRFHLRPRPAGKVVLRIQLQAFVPVQSSVREVDVSIANKLIDRWRFDPANASGERRLVANQEMIDSDGGMEIGFHILKPESPSQFGLSNDARKLGIGLVSLILDAEAPSAPQNSHAI